MTKRICIKDLKVNLKQLENDIENRITLKEINEKYFNNSITLSTVSKFLKLNGLAKESSCFTKKILTNEK